MKRGFVVTAYLSMDLPFSERLVSVFSLTLIFRGAAEPTKETIESRVTALVRNATLVTASVEQTWIPDETAHSY